MKFSHFLGMGVLGVLTFSVTYGSIRTRGGVEIERDLAVNGDSGMAGNLLVLGDASFNASLSVLGDAGVDGNLSVRGDAGFNQIADRTVRSLFGVQVNAINTVTTHGSLRIDSPITITGVSMHVSAAGGGGTSNTIRLTDGANNCDAVFACSGLTTTGPKEAVLDGGCNLVAPTQVTISELLAGCTPDPNVRNIAIRGYYR